MMRTTTLRAPGPGGAFVTFVLEAPHYAPLVAHLRAGRDRQRRGVGPALPVRRGIRERLGQRVPDVERLHVGIGLGELGGEKVGDVGVHRASFRSGGSG